MYTYSTYVDIEGMCSRTFLNLLSAKVQYIFIFFPFHLLNSFKETWFLRWIFLQINF